MNWAKIANITKALEPTIMVKQIVPIVLEDDKSQSNSTIQEHNFSNRLEQVQEQFSLEIMDTYHFILNEVRNGPYGYVFSEDRSTRCLDFINLVHTHMDYGYYKIHGFENNDRINPEESSSEEDQYCVEKRNKFAYV